MYLRTYNAILFFIAVAAERKKGVGMGGVSGNVGMGEGERVGEDRERDSMRSRNEQEKH